MNFIKATLLLFIIVFTSCAEKKVPEDNAKIMSYNIRLNIASDGENAWPNRKEFLTSQVLFFAPDVLGVQEALPGQMRDLDTLLTDYNFIGKARDGVDKGEYSAIFYNKKTVSVEKDNTFWLSETPDELSQGWDGACRRVCTYGLFTLKSTKEKFWVFNTHLDHVGKVAQKKGLKLILDKVKSVNTENLPVFITGDFNVEPNSDAIAQTKVDFYDSKEIADIIFGPEGTFTGFKYDEPVKRRIDHILVSKNPKVNVEKYAIFSSSVNFKFPSDHFPVFIEAELK